MTLPKRVPPPGEFHPAYAGLGNFLRDWINRRGPLADRWTIQIPKPRPALTVNDFADSVMPSLETWTMTRHKAAAPAPYVGQAFCYRWDIAIDNLGRCIAGDARIHYLEP